MERIRLRRLRVAGFKSLRNCEVDLDDINLFIGPNGAGKSNLVSALSFLCDVLDRNMQISVARRGPDTLLYKGPGFTHRISMEVMFDDGGYGFSIVPVEGEGRMVFESEYSISGGTSIEIPSAGRPESGYVDHCIEKGIPHICSEDLAVYHFDVSNPMSPVRRSQYVNDDLQLHPDGGNLAPYLLGIRNSSPKSYREIVDAVRQVLPTFDDFVLEPQKENAEALLLRWKESGCDKVFGPAQLSDGTMQFICLATALLRPAESQPSVMVFDEPEGGLHPEAVTIIAEMMEMISHEKQLLVCTQSSDLLDEFPPEQVVVTESGQDGTVFRRLDRSQLQPWLDDGYTMSDLWKKNNFGGNP